MSFPKLDENSIKGGSWNSNDFEKDMFENDDHSTGADKSGLGNHYDVRVRITQTLPPLKIHWVVPNKGYFSVKSIKSSGKKHPVVRIVYILTSGIPDGDMTSILKVIDSKMTNETGFLFRQQMSCLCMLLKALHHQTEL
ncbi:hypothetical protein C0J52_05997 [Blattella germanica]|nr:hypothetical protein C0J52_05997 [Blattella germanica]